VRRSAFLFLWLLAVPLPSQNPTLPARLSRPLPAVPPGKFSFAVIGDRTGTGPEGWPIFDGAVSDLNQLRPDFCVMIGDIIESAPDRAGLLRQWDEAERHLNSLRLPLLSIPGNHDIPGPQAYSLWKERMGETYRSFDYRGCHFLLLDTEESQGTGEPGFGSRQLDFAERDILGTRDAAHFFVFMHRPVWIENGALKSQWAKLESLLPKTGTTIFAGHVHALAMKRLEGRSYVILGPTGGRLRLERNPALGMLTHITWVTVEDGTCTLAFIEPGRVLSEKTALDAYDRYMNMFLLLKGQTGS
jgi:hypothetical protein